MLLLRLHTLRHQSQPQCDFTAAVGASGLDTNYSISIPNFFAKVRLRSTLVHSPSFSDAQQAMTHVDIVLKSMELMIPVASSKSNFWFLPPL